MLSGFVIFAIVVCTIVAGSMMSYFTYHSYGRSISETANLNDMRDIELGNMPTLQGSSPAPPPPAKDKTSDSPYSLGSSLSWPDTNVTPPTPSYLGPSAENTNIGKKNTEYKPEGDGITIVNEDDDAWTDVDINERSAVTGFDFGFGGDKCQQQEIIELEGDCGTHFQRR
jgi:hypothetical protein